MAWRVVTPSIADAERGSFRLSYLLTPQKDALSWTMLAYPDSRIGKGGEGGYFLLMAALPPTPADGPRVNREVVVVIDRSGSMRGEKLEQAKSAALQVVEGLEDGEAFNIIDYSDSIQVFSEKAVIKAKDTIAAARDYIKAIQAGGGTNINDAMAEALRNPPEKGMLPIVLFLTDGLPTVGERNEVKIRDAVKKANKDSWRIFTFGVGYDVNSPLLSNLAKNSRAVPTFVQPEEDVEVKVSQVFRRLSGPTLALPKLTVLDEKGTLGGSAVREVMPGELADVFDGDQVLVLGQYTKEGLIHLGLEGDARGSHKTFTFTMDTRKATVRNGYVPRLWARAKVGVLIDEVRQAGAEGSIPQARLKELTDEIVELSTTWGILTEYTSFLAAPENQFGTQLGSAAEPTAAGHWQSAPAMRSALRADTLKKLEERAGKDRDGSGGVNQEENVQTMRPGRPAAVGRIAYMDQKMQRVEITTVQQVADMTLLNRKNRWLDARILDKEDEKPEVEIDFASAAYFTLLDELTTQGRQGVLANAGDVYILHNSQRVLVHGATK
jgi:Ca-activated chloride channel family protein